MKRVPLLQFILLGALAVLSLRAQPALTRMPATSLRLPFSAATRYVTERRFAPLTFTQPIAVVTPPGETRRLFVVEKTGRIWVIPDVTAPTPTSTLFLDLRSRITGATGESDERGLLALAFHPDYATNGQFYVWYTLTTTTSAGGGLHDRLSRFKVSAANPNLADATSEQPLITQRDEASNHNGGQLVFGPDGYLYLSIGDEGNANDTLQNSQRIDKDFYSAILRLDVDQRPGSLPPNPHPAVHAGTYTVPVDNPFVGATTFNGAAVNASAVRTEFWAVGLRNPWRIAFDSATGQLWCADVGQDAREEIDIIVRGGNYGWNYREGNIAGPRGSPPAAATFLPPIWDYPRTSGFSVSGGFVYRGTALPGLAGRYLFADYLSGRIWALTPDGTNPVSADRVQQLTTDNSIVSFGLDPASGDILLVDLAEGVIKRLTFDPTNTGVEFPATLSVTGAFTSATTLSPMPGIVSYEPNVSFWSDHAKKSRWFGLVDSTSFIEYSANGNWTFPNGMVWIKHFDLELERGNPASSRRIETRFLIKGASGFFGATYRWNDAGSDATLVPDAGADATFTVTENGVARQQTWRFPGRSECLQCHTSAAGYALSFNTRQLNRTHVFPEGTQNQLTALWYANYLTGVGPPLEPAKLPALTPPGDDRASLELRIRSHLDVNCSPCHRPDGTALGSLDLRARTPLSLTGVVNGNLIDNGGSPANRVIVPGDAAHSQLLARVSAPGSRRMPPLATNERDLASEALLTQWINQLATPQPASRLANLATRAQILGGDATLISGFVVSGGPKRLLIRGVGPSLTRFGVTGALQQTRLALFRGTQAITSNTGWNTAPNRDDILGAGRSAGAFDPSPGDSALLLTLEPGDYTAQLASPTGATGVGLVELYDADFGLTATTVRLINTSVRAQVGTGGQILIPGIVVGPGAPKTVLIRAVGPGLTQFGVTGVLAQPMLTLFAGDTAYRRNVGWRNMGDLAAFQSESERLRLFPLAENGADSGLFLTLDPGAYTLQVSGLNDTTGVALVEIYEIR